MGQSLSAVAQAKMYKDEPLSLEELNEYLQNNPGEHFAYFAKIGRDQYVLESALKYKYSQTPYYKYINNLPLKSDDIKELISNVGISKDLLFSFYRKEGDKYITEITRIVDQMEDAEKLAILYFGSSSFPSRLYDYLDPTQQSFMTLSPDRRFMRCIKSRAEFIEYFRANPLVVQLKEYLNCFDNADTTGYSRNERD